MNELISQLMGSLGLDAGQAKGGAGLFFKIIKDQLEDGDFSKIISKVGNVDDVLGAAPDTDSGIGGLLGGLASAVGGEKAGSLVDLAAGFKKLDIDVGKLDDFVEVGLGFLKDKGGSEIVDLVKGILSK